MEDFINEIVAETQVSIPDYQYFNQLIKHRTVVLNSEVDESLLEKVILPLRSFEKDTSTEPVTLIIQTVGGSMIDGLTLIDIIDNYSKPLEVIVYGYAYSMGFAILCAGSKNPNVTKKCFSFTTGLWHSGSVMLSGEDNMINDVQEFNKRMDNKLKEYIIANTLIPRELYERKERYQFYFDSEELLKYGIVNEIIGAPKNTDTGM